MAYLTFKELGTVLVEICQVMKFDENASDVKWTSLLYRNIDLNPIDILFKLYADNLWETQDIFFLIKSVQIPKETVPSSLANT